MKSYTLLALALGSMTLFAGCDTVNQIASMQTGNTTIGNTGTGNTAGNTTASVTTAEMSSGIKQALGNGLTTSINTLSATDGFLGNAAVKILMPAEAQKIEKTLRAVGMGKLCDQFIQSLNRAAETAVKEAAPVFVNSLSQMTITDAYNILLSGQQDAATTFFKRTTSAALASKFSPIVASALGKNNVSTYWSQLTTAYNAIPLASEKVNTDLNVYVTQKAINGLFTQVASEELKIRSNLSGARNTNLLQKVFGYADTKK